jgi:hypothetical protein
MQLLGIRRVSRMKEVYQMKTEEVVAIATGVGVIFTAVQAILAFVTIKYFRRQTELMRLQNMRSIFDAWLEGDIARATNDVLLKECYNIEYPKSDITLENYRKRMAAYTLLNPMAFVYYNLEGKHIDNSLRPKFDKSLTHLLNDNYVYKITQESMYVEGFAEYCQKLKENAVSMLSKTETSSSLPIVKTNDQEEEADKVTARR